MEPDNRYGSSRKRVDDHNKQASPSPPATNSNVAVGDDGNNASQSRNESRQSGMENGVVGDTKVINNMQNIPVESNAMDVVSDVEKLQEQHDSVDRFYENYVSDIGLEAYLGKLDEIAKGNSSVFDKLIMERVKSSLYPQVNEVSFIWCFFLMRDQSILHKINNNGDFYDHYYHYL